MSGEYPLYLAGMISSIEATAGSMQPAQWALSLQGQYNALVAMHQDAGAKRERDQHWSRSEELAHSEQNKRCLVSVVFCASLACTD